MDSALIDRMEEKNMGYETKVILVAIAEIIRKSKDKNEIYKAVAEMANAEGVILKPLDETKKE